VLRRPGIYRVLIAIVSLGRPLANDDPRGAGSSRSPRLRWWLWRQVHHVAIVALALAAERAEEIKQRP
jgi:hypothetical protein